MKKRVSIILVIVILISCFFGCRQDLPDDSTTDVWICERPYVYLTVDAENEKRTGKIIWNEKELEFEWCYSPDGIGIIFDELYPNTTEPDMYFYGWVDYDHYNDILTCTIVNDDIHFFEGLVPLLKFKRYNKEEYIREHGPLE